MAAAQSGKNLDALIVRKEAKGHGTGSWLEGPLPSKGKPITVLEDVITTGGSSLKAVKHLRDSGYLIRRVVCIVDRQEGGAYALKEAGLKLKCLFLLEEIASKAGELLQ